MSEDLHLPTAYGKKGRIRIVDKKGHQQPVPKYLWKVDFDYNLFVLSSLDILQKSDGGHFSLILNLTKFVLFRPGNFFLKFFSNNSIFFFLLGNPKPSHFIFCCCHSNEYT